MNIAIITGASSGLGREFALSCAKMYHNVDEIWLVARRKERLESLISEITDKKCRAIPMDLCADSAIPDLERMITESGADVRLLINNAGFGKLGNIADMSVESQTGMVDLNVKALTGITTMSLKHMKRGAEIINVCSIASFAPNARLTVYSSTKAYVLSYTKGLREELKKSGINCCCVCPGPMRTEFLEVADITEGASKTFDTLPYCDAKKVAEKTLKASKKGRCVYTPTAFYKFYRLLAKLLPHSLIMKMSKA